MKKKIFIILPYKESLDPNKSGAVSIYIKDSLKYSKFKNNIKIISSNNFSNSKFFRNKNYIIEFCKKYKNEKISIIEIHNRPEYVKILKKNFPDSKIILTYHNDPLNLRGSTLSSEREFILKNCEKIIFVSKWIKKRFFIKISSNIVNNYELIYCGVLKKKKINISKKKKNILFVGKLNESKGYHIYHEVAKRFKKINPNWNFIAIGSEQRKKIFPKQNIIKEIGYLNNNDVLNYYEKSEIAIGNSVWDEPLGRIAIEASSRKCCPIITNVGGLIESKNIGIVLKKNNVEHILKILNKLTNNNRYLRSLQNNFYITSNFYIRGIS